MQATIGKYAKSSLCCFFVILGTAKPCRKIHNLKYLPKTIKCRNYKKYNMQEMNNDIQNIDWGSFYEIKNVDVALNYFNKTLIYIFDKHAPSITKKVRGKPCPWLTEDINQLMNGRDQLLRKARRTQNPNDWNMYKKSRNTCNIQIKKAKRKYHQNILQEMH